MRGSSAVQGCLMAARDTKAWLALRRVLRPQPSSDQGLPTALTNARSSKLALIGAFPREHDVEGGL